MIALLGSCLVAAGVGGVSCAEEAGMSPRPPVATVEAAAPAPSDSACRVLDVALSGNLKVPPVVGFPDRATCGAGLTLIKGGTATYTPKNDHEVNILVRILNRTPGPVQLPVRVILSPQAIQIIGSGTPGMVTAISPDSVLAGGGALWRIGSADSLLRVGDSTVAKTVAIRFAKPATHAKLALVFDGMAVVVNLVPATPPDSVPDWVRRDTSLVHLPSGMAYVKRTLVVGFKTTATQAERQAAVDRVAGVVVGGFGIRGRDGGGYLVRFAGDPTEAQLDSLAAVLRGLPQVQYAGLEWRVSPLGRRPNDSTGWTRKDWTFQPDSSSGQNWALEEIAAPLAWGCSTGDAATRVEVIDQAFDATEAASNAVAPKPIYGAYPRDLARHGTKVAGILASPGDNGTAMTGVMWKAALRLDDLGELYYSGDIARDIRIAALEGYPIVNVSLGAKWDSLPTRTDSLRAQNDVDRMIVELRNITSIDPSTMPLIVVAAGNNSLDAWYAGMPALRDSFAGNILVVGGSQAASGATSQDRWGGSDFSFAPSGSPFGKSNHGRLIDVYAPAKEIAAPFLQSGREGVEVVSGTSGAAPMVAGIAGLLRSFDPSLTPAQLKSLIVEGARKGGRSMPNDPTKFLANAYESLKLAAQKTGTPICGFPVSLAGDPGSQRVNFERTGGGRTSLTSRTTAIPTPRSRSPRAAGFWRSAARSPGTAVPSHPRARPGSTSLRTGSGTRAPRSPASSGASTWSATPWTSGSSTIQLATTSTATPFAVRREAHRSSPSGADPSRTRASTTWYGKLPAHLPRAVTTPWSRCFPTTMGATGGNSRCISSIPPRAAAVVPCRSSIRSS